MIEILIGNIAVGKSTYAKKRANEGAVIFSDDNVIDALHTSNNLYNKKLKPLYKKIENNIVNYCLKNNIDIIIDRRNHKRKTRMRYCKLAKSYNIKCKYVVFPDLPPEECARIRFESNSRGYSLEQWIEVAKKTYVQKDCIHPYEGFSEIYYIIRK